MVVLILNLNFYNVLRNEGTCLFFLINTIWEYFVEITSGGGGFN